MRLLVTTPNFRAGILPAGGGRRLPALASGARLFLIPAAQGMKAGKLISTSVAALLLAGCASGHGPHWTSVAEQSHKWGYYSGLPVTRWDSDGRTMTLLSELRYTDPKGEVWIAPAGSIVDG